MTFTGRFEDLQDAVRDSGRSGAWSDVEQGKKFKADDGAVLNWFPGTGTVQFQGPKKAKDAFEKALRVILNTPAENRASAAASERERVFVVYGHDTAAREQLELILHKLGLDPFVLANTGGGGRTIIEALENEIRPGPTRIRFGIVLMTPDDMGYAKGDGPAKAEPRARQNVVLEMGMLIAAVGRSNVAILKKGHLEVPSDAHGILYLAFNDHVRETVPKLVDRLRAAGFPLDAEKITRASS